MKRREFITASFESVKLGFQEGKEWVLWNSEAKTTISFT
jgi:hypothetical protein